MTPTKRKRKYNKQHPKLLALKRKIKTMEKKVNRIYYEKRMMKDFKEVPVDKEYDCQRCRKCNKCRVKIAKEIQQQNI